MAGQERASRVDGRTVAQSVFDSAASLLEEVYRPAVLIMAVYSESSDPFEMPSEVFFREFASTRNLHVLKFIQRDGFRYQHNIMLSRKKDMTREELAECLSPKWVRKND